MLFVYPNLILLMEERNLDYNDIADILGISKYGAHRRLRGFTRWKWQETLKLCQYFGVSDTAWLFTLGEDTVS